MRDMNKGWLRALVLPLGLMAACQAPGGAGSRMSHGASKGLADVSLKADSAMQDYLQIAAALSTDSAVAADSAARRMAGSLSLPDAAGLDSLKALQGSLREALSAFIGAPDLRGKRLAFEQISAKCLDLLRLVKMSRGVLYRAYCPMYGSQGAYWFTSADTIRNPYMGSAMPGCGEIEDTLTF